MGVGFGVNQIADDAVKEVADDNNLCQKTILEVFGAQIHKGINAKAWDERTLALAAVRTKCENKNIPQGVSNSQFLDGCCKFVIVCIQDKVMPVYFDGLDLMKYMLGEFFANYPEANDVVRDNLEHMLPLLIAKSADRNARSLEATRLTLTFLARCPCVGAQPIMAHMFASVQNHKEVAAIRGRLDLINNLIDEFGFGKAGTITMQLVMGFVRPHLDATDEKVRRAAVEVTVNCYKHKGDRTLKYVTNVKPALLKLLQQRFEELGKPSKARKQVRSAQGLAPVRGRGKKPMAKSQSRVDGGACEVQCVLRHWPVRHLLYNGQFRSARHNNCHNSPEDLQRAARHRVTGARAQRNSVGWSGHLLARRSWRAAREVW